MAKQFDQDECIPDYEREKPTRYWDPSRRLLKTIRDYNSLTKRKGIYQYFLKSFCVLRYRFWSIVTSADIPLNAQLGEGLLLPHPNGIVIHPNAIIGPNCLIFQQVTITNGVKIGCHVDIGAGAKIIGPVTIGNNVQIGANSVVIHNIPDNSTAVGIPARIVKTKNDMKKYCDKNETDQ